MQFEGNNVRKTHHNCRSVSRFFSWGGMTTQHNRNQCLVVNCMLWNVIQPGVVSNLTSFYWNKLGDWQTGYYNRRPIINFTFELIAKPQWPWEFVSPERPRFKQTLPASTSNVLCLFVTKSVRLVTAAKQLTHCLVKWSVVIHFPTLQINYNIFEFFFIWGRNFVEVFLRLLWIKNFFQFEVWFEVAGSQV